MSDSCTEITLDSDWINCIRFEESLSRPGLRTLFGKDQFKINFPEGCNVMVDAAVRLLSFMNQLNDRGLIVEMNFIAGEDGTFGYLDRIGFFKYLAPQITTIPERPIISRSDLFHGGNQGVFEIIALDPNEKDESLPPILTDKLLNNIEDEKQRELFNIPCFTFFAELYENIYLHSNTILNGYIAFQYYKKRSSLKVAFSDSGHGLLSTLRPSLAKNHPGYKDFSDSELIELVFSVGLSKDGIQTGCGLKTCAMQALKFNAELDVRLSNSHFHMTPEKNNARFRAKAYIEDTEVKIDGTHITVDIRLDNDREI